MTSSKQYLVSRFTDSKDSWQFHGYKYILLFVHVNNPYTILSIKLLYIHNITTLCLNGTLSCVDFMDVIMGDIPDIFRTSKVSLLDESQEGCPHGVCPTNDNLAGLSTQQEPSEHRIKLFVFSCDYAMA